MRITKIEPVTKTKYRIYIDEQFAFVLYKGELSRFRLKEESEVTEETIHTIKNDILVKRAKLRAMHLLNAMARTEAQLKQKLLQGGYPEDVVDVAIAYVKSFGYINDEAYVSNFIETRYNKKSKREIKALLSQKGIDAELAERMLESSYEEHSDRDAIQEIVQKKRWNVEEMDYKTKQKAYAYLMRKGFRYEDVRSVLQVEY